MLFRSGRDLMLGRTAERFVAQVEPAERDGLCAGVEQFNEVAVERSFRDGEPFVETEGAWVAEGGGAVGGAEGGAVERPFAVKSTADGKVGELKTEADGVEQRTSAGRGGEEENRIAVLTEAEAEVVARSLKPGSLVIVSRRSSRTLSRG